VQVKDPTLTSPELSVTIACTLVQFDGLPCGDTLESFIDADTNGLGLEYRLAAIFIRVSYFNGSQKHKWRYPPCLFDGWKVSGA